MAAEIHGVPALRYIAKGAGPRDRIAAAPILGLHFSSCWGRKGAMLSPPSASFRAHYQALVSSGAIEPDAAQEEAAEALAELEQRLSRLQAAAQAGPARPAVCRQGRAAAARPLYSRRSRPRQDHADGPVLPAQFGHPQAPRAFPRIHGRGARADLRLSPEHRARRDRRRRRDRAHRRVDLRRGLAFVFRRIPCHRHRRRDDPGAAVQEAVRTRHRGGRDLQRRARGSLQGRAEPGAVPAFHRADIRSHGGAAARCPHRFPAGEACRA